MYNIDEVIREMVGTMKNNYEGTPSMRFIRARRDLRERLWSAIEDNKDIIINDYKECTK